MGKGNSIGWSIIYRKPTGEVRQLHWGGIIGWYGARFRFFAFFFFLKKKTFLFYFSFFITQADVTFAVTSDSPAATFQELI